MLSLSWSRHADAAPAPPTRGRRGPGSRRARRWVGRHRRPLAALLLAAAAGVGVEGATRPPPVGVDVAVAAVDLAAGHRVAAGDLRSSRLPADAVPAGVVPVDELVGRRLAGPVRAGEPLTDLRVAGDTPAAGLTSGRVAMPVDVRSGATRWLSPGSRVSLLASRDDPGAYGQTSQGGPPPAHLVTRDAVVLDVPKADGDGLLATADAGGTTTVLLSVRDDEAAALAAIGGGWWISPVVLP